MELFNLICYLEELMFEYKYNYIMKKLKRY